MRIKLSSSYLQHRAWAAPSPPAILAQIQSADRYAGLVLEIDIRQRLLVVVAHDETGFTFIDRPVNTPATLFCASGGGVPAALACVIDPRKLKSRHQLSGGAPKGSAQASRAGAFLLRHARRLDCALAGPSRNRPLGGAGRQASAIGKGEVHLSARRARGDLQRLIGNVKGRSVSWVFLRRLGLDLIDRASARSFPWVARV